ncbi:MAG TPA: secretin N-terminal domain-containing protein, partial [Fimbriimonas sp.]|nr:secretin N-terminal domain-containing protein [Fimbriimonas sp.]
MKPKLVSTTVTTLLSLAAASAAWQAQEGPGAPAQATTGATAGVATTSAATAGGGGTTGGGQAPGIVVTPNQVTTPGAQGSASKSGQGTVIRSPSSRAARHMGKPAKPAPPPKPPWELFKLNPKTTVFLDYTDASPDMVLSFFSRTSGITILKDPSFKTTLSFTSAKKVGLDDAFDILNATLELNGYTLEKHGKLMEVVKKQAAPPAAPPMPMPMPNPAPTPPANNEASVIHVYHLEFASATQVARVVNEVYTQEQLEQLVQQIQGGGGQPQPPFFGGGPQRKEPPKVVRASAEEYSNSVVVNAPQKNQDEVKKLIDELDKSATTPLASTVFKLKYIPTDEAVEAIQNVLTANAPVGRGAAKAQDDNQGFYRFYNPFGSNRQTPSAGGQSVIGIKQTNSVIVSATNANMELVRKLIQDMDVPTDFVGTTFFVPLANAKATDVATLLNQAFTKPKNSQNDNPFFFIYSDNFNSNQDKGPLTDVDDSGKVVNIRDLTGKVNVIADPNTNGLIVVTQPSNMRLIRGIIDKIDATAEQVMIETIIVEANLDKTTKLGVEYSFLQGKAFGQKGWSGSGTQDYGLQTSKDPLQGLKYTLSGKNFSVF